MHPESLILESFLDPSTQYTKLPQPKSRSEHTDFIILHLKYGQTWLYVFWSKNKYKLFAYFLFRAYLNE